MSKIQSNNWMYNSMVKFIGENPKDELAVIWFAREEADWVQWYDDYDDDDTKARFTDAEWQEIAGRFNDMDWQWVSEIFQ